MSLVEHTTITVKINVDDYEFQNYIENTIAQEVADAIDESTPLDGGGETGGGGFGGGIGIGTVAGALRNPMGLASSRLLLLGGAPIAAGLLVKPVTEAVIAQLTAPGMPLDIRFKRMIEEEVYGFMTRQQQENTRIGQRNVIIQASPGFSNRNEGAGYESVRSIIAGDRGGAAFATWRSVDIGYLDHAEGLSGR